MPRLIQYMLKQRNATLYNPVVTKKTKGNLKEHIKSKNFGHINVDGCMSGCMYDKAFRVLP